MIYVIGSRGRLGQAIAAEYADAALILLERTIYADWLLKDSSDKVARYFSDKANAESIIFITSGLLDPNLPQEDLLKVNFFLPKNIIDGAAKLGIKVVTFGTVMEDLLQSKNFYIQTKKMLGDYVTNTASINTPVMHLRIHTLYGLGEPSPFMFLGQMLNAIYNNTRFDMTLGKQLREYHHVQDEVKAIRKIANLAYPGVMDVSHGQPVSLKKIAESVFQSLNKTYLLHVGSLPEPPEENYTKIFDRTKILHDINFRDSLPAVVEYMQEHYLQFKIVN